MNISASSGIQSMQIEQMGANRMTDETKSAVSEILEKYDPSNMTEEQEEAMKAEIKVTGAVPNRELGNMLEDAGFSIDRPQGPPPGGGKGGKQMSGVEAAGTDSDIYNELMTALEAGDDDTIMSLAKQMTNGIDYSGLFFDQEG